MSDPDYHFEDHVLTDGPPRSNRELGVGYEPCVRMYYPHMLKEDAKVWTRFLIANPNAFERVWYDVHVGSSPDMSRSSPEFLQNLADAIYRKRIDVIALKDGNYFIIEIKPVADMTALGQALTYTKYFKLEFRDRGPVLPVILCDQIGSDMEHVCDDYKVQIFSNDHPNENAWFYRPFGLRNDIANAKDNDLRE